MVREIKTGTVKFLNVQESAKEFIYTMLLKWHWDIGGSPGDVSEEPVT